MKTAKFLRILVGVLAALMVLSLFSCTDFLGSDETQGSETTPVQSPSNDDEDDDDDEDEYDEEDVVDGSTTENAATNAPETNAPETNAPETNAPETNAPETNAPETNAPETNAPETNAPETNAPETNAPETNAPETNAPETNAPETEECQHSNGVEYRDNENSNKCDKYCVDCGEYIESVRCSAGKPDPNDSCNIKCTRCGGLVRENDHKDGVPDPNDGCKVKCPVCGDVLGAPEHGEPANAWSVAIGNPQVEVAECSLCHDKIERSATSTTKGLVLFGADVIAAAKNNKKLSCTVERDENNLLFARTVCTYDGTPAEGTLTLNEGGDKVLLNVGKYVAVLVRKEGGVGRLQFWLNNANTTESDAGKAVNPKETFAADGNWHLVIFDFSKFTQIDFEKGIGWARLDFDDGENGEVRKKGDIVDVAYVGFFQSVEDANEYYAEYLKAYIGVDNCNHVPDGIWGNSKEIGKIAMHCTICGSEANVTECLHNDVSKLENIKAKSASGFVYFTADCKICSGIGVDVTALTHEGKKIFTAAELMHLANIQASTGAEGNASFNKYTAVLGNDSSSANLPFVTFTAKQAAECCLILNDGSVTLPGEYLGNYVAILYRKNAESSNSIQILYTPAESTNSTGYSTIADATVNDGNWQLAILNLTPGSSDGAKINVNNGLGWVRLDVIDPSSGAPVSVGDKMDIAYVGFFATENAASEYFGTYLDKYIGKNNCSHRFNTEWVSTGQKNKMKNTCMLCGDTIIRDCEHVPDGDWVPATSAGKIKCTCTRCGGDVIRDCTHISDENWVPTGNVEYEYKSTCTLCKQTIVKLCDHKNNSIEFAANAGEFRLVCKFCGYDRVSSVINADGAALFNPDYLYDIAANRSENKTGKYLPEVLIDNVGSNSMPYIRMKVIEKTDKETNFWIWSGGISKIENVGPYFAFLYRMSSGCTTDIDVFISADDSLGTAHGKKMTLIADGEWHLAICDFSTSKVWNGTDAVQQLRIDIFNAGGIGVNEYFDLAYAGFFATEVSAKAHYDLVSCHYGFGVAQFKAYFDDTNCAANGLDCSNRTDRGDNNPTKAFTVTNGNVANVAVQADLTGVALETVKSLEVGGWVVSPGGIQSISYRIVDADGNTSELKKLCDGKNGGTGILDNTASLGFGDDRAKGGAFQSKNVVDLTGYEGDTVTVEVVIVNGYGQSAVVAVFKNVSVPNVK